MLDIKFIRENPELVRENIKKKFQDAKLPLVDEVLELDEKKRAAITEASELRAQRNTLSKQVGMLMGQAKKDAYAADITYGTNNEFGFDYLRDNMAIYSSELVPVSYTHLTPPTN